MLNEQEFRSLCERTGARNVVSSRVVGDAGGYSVFFDPEYWTGRSDEDERDWRARVGLILQRPFNWLATLPFLWGERSEWEQQAKMAWHRYWLEGFAPIFRWAIAE